MAEYMKPFQIAGNLYFVGAYEASSHLIVTEEGLILIDTGYPETAKIIIDSVAKLGFDIKELKYILHTHGHIDHMGGTKELAELTHAKTCISAADKGYADGSEPLSWAQEIGRIYNTAFKPDLLLKDGDVITLGSAEIKCIATPGHTPGTMCFFFDVIENGKKMRVGVSGGTGLNSLKKDFLDKYALPYLYRKDYFDSAEKVMNQPVDIFIGNHTWQNDTKGKYEKKALTQENPFIDSTQWKSFYQKCCHELTELLKAESRERFVNYAHRGASAYAPENTFLSFYTGLFMGANGIETDIQLTRDHIPVLFHDDTLERVTGAEGKIQDYTFAELQNIKVAVHGQEDKIVALEDFLDHFAFRDITFEIELKQEHTEKAVIDLLDRYHMRKKTVITSFGFENLRRVKQYDNSYRVGLLTSCVNSEVLEKLYSIGAEEICPQAGKFTSENVEEWHRLGFRVRAWGVLDELLMKKAYDAYADGMTVNFPDKLDAYRRTAYALS